MNNEHLPTSIYDEGEYLDHNKNWHTEDSPYKAAFIIEIISKNNIKFEKCADVGCGAGLVTEILSKTYRTSSFTGFELSRDAQQFHKQRNRSANLEYTNANFFNSNEIYDLVLCLDVFEHVEDYFGFLRKLKDRGKKFIFNIPLDMSALKILTPGIQYAREEVGHLHYFSEYTALQTLKDCGYKIIDYKFNASYLFLRPRNIRQVLILPMRLLFSVFGKKMQSKFFGGVSIAVYAE
uniref:class I SAM-dependent methyltransferase n=1 Tax=Polynucleobacter sp. TaxID=2029855 RepID=UPI004048AC40